MRQHLHQRGRAGRAGALWLRYAYYV